MIDVINAKLAIKSVILILINILPNLLFHKIASCFYFNHSTNLIIAILINQFGEKALNKRYRNIFYLIRKYDYILQIRIQFRSHLFLIH